MKKIMFFIHDLMGGGAEKVLVNMVNNLDREKYDITVIALFDVGINKDFLASDIKYKYVFKKMFRGNKHLFKLFSPEFSYSLLGKEKYDIVVSYLEGMCSRIISGCTDENTKKIAWIHRQQNEQEYASSFRSKEEADRLYSRFDRIVCVAESLKQEFCNKNNQWDKTVCLYNVNETEKILMLSKEKAEENLFNEEYTKIAFVGKIIESKGVLRLANIHIRLKEENIPHCFYLLGTGNLEEKIKKILEEAGCEDNFVFLGYRENPYKYISKCDMFVCSSFAEGFSTATTEALVLSKPCVVTDCSGMKELLGNNNEYGIVTKNDEDSLYEGLKKILCDKELFETYKQKAGERGLLFSKEKTLAEIEKNFDNI